MDDLPGRNLRGNAGLGRALEDQAKAFGVDARGAGTATA